MDTGKVFTYSEIAFPPLVMVLSLNSERPNPDLMKITEFRHDDYDQRRPVTLMLRSVQTNTHLPADYSTRERLEKIRAEQQGTKREGH